MANRLVDGQATVFGTQVRVPKSAELVARALRLQIVRGDLKEGDGLPPEAVLMQQFGVSRPTLREAFRILESEQLISIHRGARGGGRVHAPNGDVAARYAALVLQYQGTTLRDVYQARAVIEPACVRLVATRRTARHLKELRAALEAEVEPSDPRDVSSAAHFHRLVVEMAGNETLALVSSMVQHILELATVTWVRAEAEQATSRRTARAHRAHEELYGHIEHKDADAAELVWAKHLADTQGQVLSAAGGETVLDLFG
jgi:DNA-binding FadR family transcriptional regulator